MTMSRRIKPQLEVMESMLLLSAVGLHVKKPDVRHLACGATEETHQPFREPPRGDAAHLRHLRWCDEGLQERGGVLRLERSRRSRVLGDVTVMQLSRITRRPMMLQGGTITLADANGTIKLTLMGPPWTARLPAAAFLVQGFERHGPLPRRARDWDRPHLTGPPNQWLRRYARR